MGKTYNIGKYAERGDWPIFRSSSGRTRPAGDNWGYAECPFCDKSVISEGQDFQIGDKCWNCGARITDVKDYP